MKFILETVSARSPSFVLPVLLAQAVTLINLSLDHMLVLDHFTVHVSQKVLLALQKLFDLSDIHCPTIPSIVPQRLELFTKAFFEDFKPIFTILKIQFG